MFNNFDDEQEHFSYLAPEELNPLQTGGTMAGPSAPVAAPRVAEDMFATVDKTGPGANANFNQNLSARPAFSPNSGAPLTPNQSLPDTSAATALPGSGSFKYLIIGIFTLLVILGGGYAAYKFILKPQFTATTMPTPTVQEPQITPEIVNTDTPTEITPTEIVATSDMVEGDNANIETATATVTVPELNKENVTSTMASSSLDSDGDSLTDADENNVYFSNPNKIDTDDDGLNDREEVKIYKTDPNNSDTDGDSYKDGVEVKGGYNPNGQGRLLIVK